MTALPHQDSNLDTPVNSRALCQLSYAGSASNATPLPRRFWAKVEVQADGCWLWTGAKSANGYGSWGVDGKTRSTHRSAYEAFYGTVPEGLTLDHLCRVRHCCCPTHLEAVTNRVNCERSPLTTTGRQACLRCGSPFHVMPSGRRRCTQCRAAYQRDFNRRNSARRTAASAEVPLHVHGTKNGYSYYKCRCELCAGAWRAYYRDYMAARRKRATRQVVAA